MNPKKIIAILGAIILIGLIVYFATAKKTNQPVVNQSPSTQPANETAQPIPAAERTNQPAINQSTTQPSNETAPEIPAAK